MIARFLIPLMMGLWTAGSPAGEVAEVRIEPTGSQTEISIMTNGEVQVRDFLLEDPARLIVDLEGARHSLPGHAFEGITRGGVVRLRTSQFREDVVRLVFELSRPLEYSVRQGDGSVRVLFRNPGKAFEAWSTSPGAQKLDPAVAAQLERSATGARADAAGAAQQQQSAQPEISVTYDSAGMLEVISGFAEFAGVSIVPGSGVAGKTVRGVDIQDQPWDVALNAILASQGLGWRRTESGIILVDELSALRSRDTLQTETRVFRINYAGADSVANTLRELTSEKGRVVSYQGTNSVIVTDVPSVVTRMDSLINVLDRRTPQVAIEAKLIFVDRTKVNQLGIGYSLRDEESTTAIGNALSEADQQQQGGGQNIATVTPGGDAVSALANADGRLAAPALSILAHTAFGSFNLFSFLDALSEQQLTDVQAAPTIQVVDNQSARIQVGEDVPVRTLEQGAQTQQAQVTVQFEQTGIILEVTPHVTNNNQVLLEVMAERSGINLGQSDVGFTIDRQIGETQVLVDNGETAVIGGLTRSEVTRSVSGIPGLMDIPVLGALFRTSLEQEFKEDLIILVTPHVSSPTADVTTVSSASGG